MCSRSLPLSELEVIAVDCQATAAAPRGRLLEIGWARVHSTVTPADALLIALPDGERIPPAVGRITGISGRMMRDAVAPRVAWRRFAAQAATLARQPAPTIIHFARFELPFLHALAGGVPPLDVVCTHDVARRLLPDLPRCSLRAVTGYFGRAVGALRRSADHVAATAFVWRELVRLLEAEEVSTWDELREWLAAPAAVSIRRRRVWPMPRDVRLSVPDAPGVYRMLRTSGDVLYVGKAASLHHRVNSYFRKQTGVPERMLEMLSQARALSFDVTPTPLEAALLEADEIKRHRPPYNIALTLEERAVWFTGPDLGARSRQPSARCPLGPFASADTLDRFGALVRQEPAALVSGGRGPDATAFRAGYEKLCAAHRELGRVELPVPARLLRLGTRLWQEGRRDVEEDDNEHGPPRLLNEWPADVVQTSLERLALRMALARRRAIWLTRLVDASVWWCEPGVPGARLMVIENGIVVRTDAGSHDPPVPPGYRRPVDERREAFTLACFDRLRVLSTELKRLVGSGAPVAVRLGAAPPLADARLASALWWV